MAANTTGGVSFDTDDETELILESIDESIEREVEPIGNFPQVSAKVSKGLAEENSYMDLVHQARILRIVEGTDEIGLNTITKTMGITE